MVIIAPKLSSANIFSTSLDRNPKPEFFLCATLLVPAFKRNNFASSSPTSVKLCKQKKPLDTVSPFPQGNGFSDSVSFHLYNSNGRPKKKDHKHDISSSKVSTQFIKKKSRQTSDNLVKGPLKSTSAYRAFEQHQTGSNSILSWLTRSLDEPSVQIRIWLFLSSSSNSANEPCILLRQGVEHTAHHFRFRISRSSTILCRLSGQWSISSFP